MKKAATPLLDIDVDLKPLLLISYDGIARHSDIDFPYFPVLLNSTIQH
jgi:hypothetical protein